MAESQHEHRIDIERRQLESDIRHRDEMVKAQRAAIRATSISDGAGQVLGFIVVIACVAAGAYAGLVHQNGWIAAIFLSVPVGGIVRAVRGMTKQEKTK